MQREAGPLTNGFSIASKCKSGRCDCAGNPQFRKANFWGARRRNGHGVLGASGYSWRGKLGSSFSKAPWRREGKAVKDVAGGEGAGRNNHLPH